MLLRRQIFHSWRWFSTMGQKCASSGHSNSYEGPGHATVTITNEEVPFLMIDGVSEVGFRLNNRMRVFGPMAIFPTCVLGWMVRGIEDVNPQSLALFRLVNPKPDIVIVGMGSNEVRVPKDVFRSARIAGLNVEFLSTENAISTYNFLCYEGRAVGAALIPPDNVDIGRHIDHIQSVKDPYERDIF